MSHHFSPDLYSLNMHRNYTASNGVSDLNVLWNGIAKDIGGKVGGGKVTM